MENLEDMLLLLNIIKNGYNYSYFLEKYMDQEKIILLLDIAKTEEYIEKVYGDFIITNKGKDYLNKVNDKLERKGIERNIARLNKYEIEKISLEDIYLPKDF